MYCALSQIVVPPVHLRLIYIIQTRTYMAVEGTSTRFIGSFQRLGPLNSAAHCYALRDVYSPARSEQALEFEASGP